MPSSPVTLTVASDSSPPVVPAERPSHVAPVVSARAGGARPAKSSARRLERRRLYIGEGLGLRVVWQGGDAAGEIIDLTPEGIGVAILDGQALPAAGEVVVLEHTGRAMAGVRQRAVVRNVSEGTFARKTLPRLGLALVGEHTERETAERRRGERYACADRFPVTATAISPLFFREWLHFGVTHFSSGGMTLETSIRNKGLLVGLELSFTVTLPLVGTFTVDARIKSVRRDAGDRTFVVGVAWATPPKQLLNAVSEYLLLGDKDLSPARLRAGGLQVGSVERAVTYGYATGERDYQDILALRLAAHRAEGRYENVTADEMASKFDAHSRHITCRFGGRIVGYVRVIYVDGDPERSQYVSWGGHVVPDWLWEAGFVEAGAGATDPEFQRAGIFFPLMQHAVRVALQSGYGYMLGACSDELLEMYCAMGFEVLETRMVEPKPGWSFRSHLICLDTEKLVREPPSGKFVESMASVVHFVGLPDAP